MHLIHTGVAYTVVLSIVPTHASPITIIIIIIIGFYVYVHTHTHTHVQTNLHIMSNHIIP